MALDLDAIRARARKAHYYGGFEQKLSEDIFALLGECDREQEKRIKAELDLDQEILNGQLLANSVAKLTLQRNRAWAELGQVTGYQSTGRFPDPPLTKGASSRA